MREECEIVEHSDKSQATKSGIPPGARWTKIDRRLVNPEALEKANERFEERLDCVIVLRVLTKDEIQKLADSTRKLRGKHHHHSHKVATDIAGDDAAGSGSPIHDSASGSTRPTLRRVVSDPAVLPCRARVAREQRPK